METTALLPREQWFLKETRRIVEEHYPEHDFNVSTLCTHLGKSRVTLYRMLRKTPHQSAVQLIRSTRLKHALSLLKEGEVNVREVAASSGFHNHSYFTKCFHRQYGMNPSEFIRQASQTS
jgi:AraC-like DNA-binding protein